MKCLLYEHSITAVSVDVKHHVYLLYTVSPGGQIRKACDQIGGD